MLAATQTPYISHAINTAPLVAPQGGMGGSISIDWSGPIQPLLEKMAHMTQYKLKIMGNEPPIPIIVSVTAKNAVIADIIKNAGLQAGKRANIVVYPNTRIIELRYNVS
jgi:defect-in-organelle-trafficking protein DotD